MKKLIAITLVMMLALTACTKSEPPSSPVPDSRSESQSESIPASESEPRSDSSSASADTDPPALGTAFFSLGRDLATKKAMAPGDTIGDWTLTDIEFDYLADGTIGGMIASFDGTATITGTLRISDFGVEFTVADDDMGKMPCYLRNPGKEYSGSLYMLLQNLPEDLSATLQKDSNYQCEITINSFSYADGQGLSTNTGNLVDIELSESQPA